MPKLTRPIVLVGPMGSGKSTVGRALSGRFAVPLMDVDDFIVKVSGKSIPEIFKQEGESGFRKQESAALASCLKENQVVASGGGIVTQEVNRGLIKAKAYCVYLYAPVEVQYSRTLRDNGRPMIYTKDRKARLQELFTARDPLYRELADLIIDSAAMNPAQCAELIMQQAFKEGICRH